MLSTKEKHLLDLLLERYNVDDSQDEVLCTMMLTRHPHKTDNEYYLDGAIDFIENNPDATLEDVRDHLVAIRPESMAST